MPLKLSLSRLSLLRLAGGLVIFVLLLCTPILAQAQRSTRTVSLPNQDYQETTQDLVVKVLGGVVQINRTWSYGKWYLNPRWSDLILLPDPLDGVQALARGDQIYTRPSGSNLYSLDINNRIARITDSQGKTSGWQWRNLAGDTIDYDAQGRLLGYADRNGVRVAMVRDGNGRWTGVKDHLGRQVITISYDGAGLPVQVSDNAGHFVSYQWSGSAASTVSPNGAIGLALLTQVTDSRGGSWKYTYNSNGYIETRLDHNGGQISLTYMSQPQRIINLGSSIGSTKINNTQAARIATIKDEAGAITSYSLNYNSTKQQYLIGLQGPGGASQNLLYDKQGRLLQNTVNGQAQLTRSLEINHNIVIRQQDTDQRGLVTTIDYNLNQQPLKITYPDGSSETNQYDSLGHKTRNVNPLGIVSTWSYDSKGNPVKYVEAQGKPEQRTTKYTYDQYGQLISQSRGAGDGAAADTVTESYQYDDSGNVVKYTNGLGNSATATYNSLGQILVNTDGLGRITHFTYDALGNLLTVTNALNQTTQYTYDGMGRRTQVTSPAGRTQTARYDLAGRPIEVIAPGQDQGTQAQYDLAGNLTQLTSPGGLTAKATYDSQGRLTSITDPAGNVASLEYGAAGDPLAGLQTATQYPSFRQTYKYDQRNRLTGLTRQLGAASTDQYRSFDAAGRLAGALDANGNGVILTYDALGRLTQLTDPLAQDSKQSWDAQDNPISVTDAKGNTYAVQYDKAGRVSKETRPTGGAIQYSYDYAGQLVQRTDAAGNIRTYSYDAAGRVTLAEHRLSGIILDERITASYDADGQLTSYQQQDGNGNLISSASYTRDAQGRITQSAITYGKVGGGTFSFAIGQNFNADGLLASQQYLDGSQTSYSYSQGRLSQVTLPDASQVTYGDYNWYAPGKISTPGTTETISVDALQRPTKIQVQNTASETLASRQYQYDATGNITSAQSELGQTQYSYDKLGRLTQAIPEQNLQTKGVPQERYSYDAAGNRTTSQHQNGIWSYNADNQLTSYPHITPFTTQGMALDTQVSYTAQGHTAREVNQQQQKDYGYNAAERLTSFSSTPAGAGAPSVQASYRYDPFGRRISKSVTQGGVTTTTYFIYGQWGLMAETDHSGKLTRAYGFNPLASQAGLWSTEPVWQANVSNGSLTDSGTSFNYIANDYSGAPILAATKNGAISWKAVSEAYGATGVLPGASIEMNLRLPGQYFDAETGDHYNYFRNYRPSLGRYAQSDPIGLDGGLNAYLYANGNPVTHIDFSGRSPAIVPVIIGGLINGIINGLDAHGKGCSGTGTAIAFGLGFVTGAAGVVALPIVGPMGSGAIIGGLTPLGNYLFLDLGRPQDIIVGAVMGGTFGWVTKFFGKIKPEDTINNLLFEFNISLMPVNAGNLGNVVSGGGVCKYR